MSDTKRFLVWLGVIAWAFFSLVFPVNAQQCSEDQYAANVIIQKKLGTSNRVTGAVGGFGGPESVPAGGSDVSFSEDWNCGDSDTLTCDITWTEAAGDASIDYLDIFPEQWVSRSEDYNQVLSIASSNPLTGANGYSKITFTVERTNAYPFLAFRYTNSSNPFYAIAWATGDKTYWQKCPSAGASCTDITSDAAKPASGNSVGITWTGTGASTTVRVWINPTGASPTSVSEWGGDSSPDITFSDPGVNNVDTGVYVGVGSSAPSFLDTRFDNFSAGDIP